MEDTNVYIFDQNKTSPSFDKVLRVVEKNPCCSFKETVLEPKNMFSFEGRPIEIWISNLNSDPRFSMIEIVDEPEYFVFAHFIPNEDYLDRLEWFAAQLDCEVIYSDEQIEIMSYD